MPRSELIESLLTGVAPDAPCGPNLEYQPDYLLLEQSAAGKREQQYGDTVIPAEAPDWTVVERLANDLLHRTKDLRVAAYLTRSWTELRGIAGYADGLQVIAGLLDTWWDTVHPQLGSGDEHDPTPRMNALVKVAGAHDCARAARRQILLDRLSVKDIEQVLDGQGADLEHYPGGRERLEADLRRARDEGHPALSAGLAALDTLDAIRARVTAQLGAEWSPEASDFERALRRMRAEVLPVAGTDPAQTDAVSVSGNPGDGNAVRSEDGANIANLWRAAELGSRDDVQLSLEKMCRYFERHEPSHPAPILLRRVQRLLTLDFYEIIRDIAPESLPRLDMLSGQQRSE